MDKFLLAENPVQPDAVYILHTVNPKCLIEAVLEKEGEGDDDTDIESSGLPYELFTYKSGEEQEESWALVVRDIYDKSDMTDVNLFLQEAWKWYNAYLEQEDKHLNDSERENYLGSVN